MKKLLKTIEELLLYPLFSVNWMYLTLMVFLIFVFDDLSFNLRGILFFISGTSLLSMVVLLKHFNNKFAEHTRIYGKYIDACYKVIDSQSTAYQNKNGNNNKKGDEND